MKRLISISILIAALTIPLHGVAEGAVEQGGAVPVPAGQVSPDDSNPVAVDLLADVSVAAATQPFRLGVHFRLAPGWHIYAQWPGNTGEPTNIRLTSTTPYTGISEVRFQHPSTYDRDERDLTGFGYDQSALATAEVVVSERPASGNADFQAELTWLACKHKCVAGSTTKKLSLPVGDAVIPLSQPGPFAIPMPDPLESDGGWLAAVDYSDGVWKIKYRISGFSTVDEFAPQWIDGGDCLVDSWAQAPVDSTPGVWELIVTMRGSDCLPFAGGFMKGRRTGSTESTSVRFKAYGQNPWKADAVAPTDAAVTAGANAGPTIEPATEPATGGFSWYFLLLAFVGGLLLNVMPCVIPVIVPKLNHLVKTAVSYPEKKERHRMLLLNGFAYSAGIFLVMIGFAVVVVVLKTAGHQVGWGFQFQNPLFLAVMTAVLMIMSLGMLGVFPLQAVSHTEDLRGLRAMRKQSMVIESFLTGLLVTFLGTPCTAPLLGPAVGFAFLAGTAQIFAFFAVLALGFSLPFILLAVFPGWTEHLKNFRVSEEGNKWSHGLAFFLLATMVWLVGVVGSAYGIEAVSQVLWFLLTLSVLAWVYGLRCEQYEKKASSRLEADEKGISANGELDAREKAGRKETLRRAFYRDVKKRRVITALMLLAIGAASGIAILRFDDGDGRTGETLSVDSPVKWQKWSQAAVDKARSEGRTVFVDVTAAWCMNCRTNEKLILDRVETADMFREMGVLAFQADFSRHDPAISALITSHKRVGVPVYLVYPPCTGDPIILPEILTPDIFMDALKQVGPSLKDGCPVR